MVSCLRAHPPAFLPTTERVRAPDFACRTQAFCYAAFSCAVGDTSPSVGAEVAGGGEPCTRVGSIPASVGGYSAAVGPTFAPVGGRFPRIAELPTSVSLTRGTCPRCVTRCT